MSSQLLAVINEQSPVSAMISAVLAEKPTLIAIAGIEKIFQICHT